jgi:hypothetical protein
VWVVHREGHKLHQFQDHHKDLLQVYRAPTLYTDNSQGVQTPRKHHRRTNHHRCGRPLRYVYATHQGIIPSPQPASSEHYSKGYWSHRFDTPFRPKAPNPSHDPVWEKPQSGMSHCPCPTTPGHNMKTTVDGRDHMLPQTLRTCRRENHHWCYHRQ